MPQKPDLSNNVLTLIRTSVPKRLAFSQSPNLESSDQTLINGQASLEKDPQADDCRYTIVQKLGEGSSGGVFLARDAKDSSLKALKISGFGLTGDDRESVYRRRNEDELKCMKVIGDHFAVVKLHDASPVMIKNAPTSRRRNLVGTDMQFNLLMMEFGQSGDLRRELKFRSQNNLPFNSMEAGILFVQLLIGLEHIHSKGILHRDIKCSNIFVMSSGMLKIGDFGFATSSWQKGEQDYLGTPYYIPPEMWNRERYDEKVDIFALGVVFYEMLNLERPFKGKTHADLRDQVCNARYPPAAHFPELVDMMLHPDPRRRPSAQEILRSATGEMLVAALVRAVHQSTRLPENEKAPIVDGCRRFLKPSSKLASSTTVSSLASSLGTGSPKEVLSARTESNEMIVKEGTLRKQSGDGSWKDREVRIVSNDDGSQRTLVLFAPEKRNAVSSPLKDFYAMKRLRPEKGFGKHSFALVSKKWATLVFQARSDAERDAWMTSLAI